MTKDLVCGQDFGGEKPRFITDYDTRTYSFCSAECKRKFDDHPDYFIHKDAKEKLGIES